MLLRIRLSPTALRQVAPSEIRTSLRNEPRSPDGHLRNVMAVLEFAELRRLYSRLKAEAFSVVLQWSFAQM